MFDTGLTKSKLVFFFKNEAEGQPTKEWGFKHVSMANGLPTKLCG
jgi:hypothetical protein